MSNMPPPEDVKLPWYVVSCYCLGKVPGCNACDGHEWYFRNADTGQIVSEMMRDAMERHG